MKSRKPANRPIAILTIMLCSTASALDDGEPGSKKLSSRLQGEYSYTATEHCAYSSGFGPPPVLQALGPVIQETSTLHGTLVLRENGTGTIAATIVSLQSAEGNGATPALQSRVNCSVTLEVAASSALRMQRTCGGTRIRGTGSEGARTWTVSPVTETGYVHGDTIALADAQIAVEVVSTHGIRLHRVCHRSATAHRIEKLQ